MKMLNPNNPSPLYSQLQEDLKRDIENGVYKVNELIPTEKELQDLYSVSRITVRKAIEGLVFEGMLQKKQGIGTIVCKRRMAENTAKLQSFTEKFAEQGFNIRTKVLEVSKISSSSRIAKHLQIEKGEKVIYVKRLRLVEDEPIALFHTYMRADIGPTEFDDYSGSLFQLLEQKYGIDIYCSERTIFASEASEEVAELLLIKPGTPTIMVCYSTYDRGEQLVEYAEGFYRSDKYEYKIKLIR
jgi:GntR family transcriptional regulator